MDDRPNYFVRTLISVLVAALAVLVGISFSLGQPQYGITGGIITVILIIVVLVLSESFNQLSIGKVLSLTKEVAKKKEENTTVKEENKELRQNLFQIVSNIQQSQVNNTFNAPPEAWLKLLGVVPATEPKEEAAPEEAPPPDAATQGPSREDEFRQRSRLRRSAEELGLRKYVAGLSLPESSIIYGAEFSTAFHGIDPIMERRVIFDCFLKGTDVERFVEVRHRDMTSPMVMDSLYIMLSKINLYRQAKNTNAELILVLVSTNFDQESRASRYERLLDSFQPAIANKLLRIEHVQVTQEEAQNAIEERQPSLL
ncbi:MAG: hypothetical protein ABIJ01_06070 [Pseudomonadota bacterium]